MGTMRRPSALIALAALMWGCAHGGVDNEPAGVLSADPIAAAAATITASDMIHRIGVLSHDSMMGRDTPSPGLEKAAAYLAGEFLAWGLEPRGGEESFLQRYPLPLRALDTTGVHFGTVNESGGDNRMLRYGTDFAVMPAGQREGVDMFHGRLVWVGMLSDAGLPPREWAGRVPLVTVPGTGDRGWRIALGTARRAAVTAGATALGAVLDEGFPAESFERLVAAGERRQRALVDPAEVPVFIFTRQAAREIAAREGAMLESLPSRDAEPIEFQNVRAHFAAVARVLEEVNPPNVVAALTGRDPVLRDTYIVVSAHMDHVGVGTADARGDSIYNGADDNASGTSTLLELAQAFASMEEQPRRSILFLAVSGEEKGLLGSRWFAENPTIPLDRVVANINVDMIGRNAPDSIVVIGMEYSTLGAVVRSVAGRHEDLGLSVVPDPWPEERFFYRSDHFNFVRHEIPALFFFSGVHDDYHRPSDEVARIDGDKAARVARLVFLTLLDLAESPEAPSWHAEGLSEVRALTR